jgi:glyoxylase-like metal-dependent hydrolase (beta-lactamase superfamily II)
MVYETGVVVIDAPTSYAQHIPKAIAEVTNKPITHIVYSHAAIDHIGGSKSLGGQPIIIAQDETERLLVRANDPNRPIPTITFRDKYTLKVGSQILEFSYHGNAHEPGNIFIFAPAQRTLMVVDVIFPGWMPWRAFALAQDIPGYFAQVEEIKQMKWDTLVSGHVERTGTHADVEVQLEFMNDLRNAAREALKTTKPGEGLDISDKENPWAYYGNYIDRVAIQCVNKVTPKWNFVFSSIKSDTALSADVASAKLLADKIRDVSTEKPTEVSAAAKLAAAVSGKVYRFSLTKSM